MFDIGFLELLIIGVVGLLVLGPERLPKAARTAGLWIGRIKRSVAGMQREISAQLEAEELRQKLKEQERKLDDSVNQAKRSAEQAKRSVESIADTPNKGNGGQADSTGAKPAPASQRLDDAVDSAASASSSGASASTLSRPSTPSDDTASSEHKDSATR
ncbi:Sec-independent protein translocase protein TatB [Halomonas litopenaei]|uniref:Sec-independent protein translocase protein TatB n=1 Tax=Halomonas litopenaei TaxID=2109328 RepID=UPI000C4B03DC|nr:twin-arginine translocase subunit TatB [Halomonas sp.]|tara:strand:- start:1421 stop:1897 length:477 start_codon:yes stop_codon:yes gene_type:complete